LEGGKNSSTNPTFTCTQGLFQILTISLTEIVPCLLSLKLANITKLSGWCSSAALEKNPIEIQKPLHTTQHHTLRSFHCANTAAAVASPRLYISALVSVFFRLLFYIASRRRLQTTQIH
jgi:hypothetical protein